MRTLNIIRIQTHNLYIYIYIPTYIIVNGIIFQPRSRDLQSVVVVDSHIY